MTEEEDMISSEREILFCFVVIGRSGSERVQVLFLYEAVLAPTDRRAVNVLAPTDWRAVNVLALTDRRAVHM